MTNSELYNYLMAREVPSAIAAQAADLISLKCNEAWLGNNEAVTELADTFIKLYAIEKEQSLVTLKRKLV